VQLAAPDFAGLILPARAAYAYTGKQETSAAPNILRCLFNIRAGTFGKLQCDIRIRDDYHKPLGGIRPSCLSDSMRMAATTKNGSDADVPASSR
jgi:hypothetical protein